MRFEIREFDEADLDAFVPQESQRQWSDQIKQLDWKVYRKTGFVMTGVIGEKVVTYGGVVQIHPGVGEAWLVISGELDRKELFHLFRGIKRIVQSELSTGYHRMQMYVDSAFEPGIKFAKILGMSQEGHLKEYPSKGVDSYLFART